MKTGIEALSAFHETWLEDALLDASIYDEDAADEDDDAESRNDADVARVHSDAAKFTAFIAAASSDLVMVVDGRRILDIDVEIRFDETSRVLHLADFEVPAESNVYDEGNRIRFDLWTGHFTLSWRRAVCDIAAHRDAIAAREADAAAPRAVVVGYARCTYTPAGQPFWGCEARFGDQVLTLRLGPIGLDDELCLRPALIPATPGAVVKIMDDADDRIAVYGLPRAA